MREVLNGTVIRRLQLIEQLTATRAWVSLEEITKKLNCSQKTLLKDIEMINEHWQPELYIEFSKKTGVILVSSHFIKSEMIYREIFKVSKELHFLEQIFFKPDQDAEYWIKHLFLSEPTFYRMINQLEQALAKRGLTLQRKPFRIVAENERWVRLFYLYYFMEAHGPDSWPFTIDKQKLMTTIAVFAYHCGKEVDSYEALEHAYLLMISLTRSSQGLMIDQQQCRRPPEGLALQVEGYGQDLVNLIEASEYPQNPAWKTEIIPMHFFDQTEWSNQEHRRRIIRGIDEFLANIVELVNFPLPKSDHKKIRQQLLKWYTEDCLYPFPVAVLQKEAVDSGENIRRFYPIFGRLVPLFLKKLEKPTNFPWEGERANDILCLLLKEWTALPKHLETLRRRASILIISDIGYKHGKMLESFMEAQYPFYLEMSVFPESIHFLQPSDLAELKKYDLVVTTSTLPNYQANNLLVVDNYFSESDWLHLAQRIVGIHREKAEAYLANFDEKNLSEGHALYAKINSSDQFVASFFAVKSSKM